nr:Major Facilitator Superfamily (MFS) putative [Albugo laibachii Nc14]|eukprot:CCA24186.1 Major Facilitator Superfamily (MFS) putative [Albugo laibachii Nc14]
MGVMLGYLLGTVSNWIGVRHEGGAVYRFAGLEAWRWPFLAQFVSMCPIMIAVFFVPSKHLTVRYDLDFSATTSCSSDSGVDDCEHSKLLPPAHLDLESDSTRIPELIGENKSLEFQEHEPKASAMVRSWSNRHDYMTSGRRHHERKSRHLNSSDLNHSCGRTEVVSFLPTPPTSRTSSRHDEEDALLASAGMYGNSSQRGMRQLVANQQHHYNSTELDSCSPSTHRSFSSGLSRTNPTERLFYDGFMPDNRGSQQVSDKTAERTSSKAFDDTISSTDDTVCVNSTASLNYGALDIISSGSPPLPQAFEGEAYERYPAVSLQQGFITLVHIPVFGLIVFGLTAVYFVVTGVQYWSTIFMIKSLHASKHLVNVLFVFVAGTGPIMGVFFGGWLVDRHGGYLGPEQRAKALGICMVLGVIAFIIASITTFLNDIYITALFLWLLLFFGGSILPACTGIFISVVPARYRALASSLSVMIFNLFGYSLSPYLTGWIMEAVLAKHLTVGSYFEYCDEACAYRIGFRFCLLWSVWSFLCIGTAWTLAKRDLRSSM